MKKIVSLLAVLAIFIFCGTAFAASVMDKDVIVVGTEGTYPPFEFHDKTGALVGYDVDLVNAVAEKLGKKIEWVDMAFDGLIPALLTKKIDMIAACMSVTSARSKKVDFSDPYVVTYSAFITLKDDDKVKGLEDLKNKKVSVQLGTTEDLYISGVEGVDVKKFSKLDDAVREISLNRVDAAFMDEPVAKDYIASTQFEGKLKVAFTVELEGAPKALAVNKDQPVLLASINDALKELKEDGTLSSIEQKWEQ